MKRIFLIAVLTIGMMAPNYAQKKNVSLARNKAMNVESPDFEGAKTAIEAALQDETTKDLAETWYVAGLVYQKIIDNDANQAYLGGTPNTTLQGESAIKSHDYYLVAYDKDLLPDAKGKVKPKYGRNIAKALTFYYNNMVLVNYGITAFNEHDFENAIRAFEVHLGIPDLAMFEANNPFVKDTTYYQIYYYTGLAYERIGNSDKTLEIFEKIKDKGYEEVYVNQHLSDLYKERNDTANYLRVLEEGYKRFPNEFFFLGNLINHYIFNGQEELGIDYLNQAIEADPNNAQYHNVKGSVMETLNRFEEAEVAYDKALELDPQLADALNNKGRMIYIRADKYEKLAMDQRDPKIADKLQAEAEKLYAESLPYFEKVAELDNTDLNNLKLLKSIYYRLSRKDKSYQKKYDAVDAQIKALQ